MLGVGGREQGSGAGGSGGVGGRSGGYESEAWRVPTRIEPAGGLPFHRETDAAEVQHGRHKRALHARESVAT